MFDLLPHFSGIPTDFAPRKPDDLVPLLGQISVAALIMLAAFVGLMMLTIDLNDQLQVPRNRNQPCKAESEYSRRNFCPRQRSVRGPFARRRVRKLVRGVLADREKIATASWISPQISLFMLPPVIRTMRG